MTIQILSQGLQDNVKSLNDSMIAANSEMRHVEVQLQKLDTALASAKAAAARAEGSIGKDRGTLASLDTLVANGTFSTGGVENLKQNIKIFAEKAGINELVDTVDKANSTMTVNTTFIKDKVFLRLREAEKILFINATLLADRVFRRKITEEFKKKPAELATDL